jgi:hypothetical protein
VGPDDGERDQAGGERVTAPLFRGLLTLLSLCAVAGSESPPPPSGISVTTPVVVSGDLPEAPHVEPILAAHPTDPRLLFGAAVAFVGAGPGQGMDSSVIAGFRSADGGRSWSRVPFPACRIDPWVRFGSDGSLFLACLGRASPLVVYRSADGGRTWEEPRRVPVSGGGVDRPVLSAGRAPGASRETVYVGFGQYSPAPGLARPAYGAVVSQSLAGRTFSEPAPLRHDNLGQQPFDSVVLSSGVYVLFSMDYTDSSERLLAHRRTWAVKTGDGGRTWSLPALVFEQAGQEMPWSVAADPSPLHRDRLYLAVDGRWQRQRSETPGVAVQGSRGGLFLLVSDDGAESWRSAVTLSDAPPGADAATPALAVNREGVVGVAWYDTRRDPRGECFDLYFTASRDGGATFLPNVRVTPEPSCPGAVERQRGVAARWPFGGDYSGLAATADGSFHLLWADSSGGGYRISSAVARVPP